MKIKLADLIMDPLLVKLRPVNLVFVSRYRQAYRSEKDLGDIIINKKTKEIVSGNHRVTALLQEYDGDKVIEVAAIIFPTRKAVLEKFVQENADHGNPLSGFSRKLIAQELTKEGMTTERIANLFGVSAGRIVDWAGENVIVLGESKPAKRGVPIGSSMTKKEYSTHVKRDRGISAYSQAEQLTRWINQGLIRLDCTKTINALSELQVALNKFFKKQKAA